MAKQIFITCFSELDGNWPGNSSRLPMEPLSTKTDKEIGELFSRNFHRFGVENSHAVFGTPFDYTALAIAYERDCNRPELRHRLLLATKQGESITWDSTIYIVDNSLNEDTEREFSDGNSSMRSLYGSFFEYLLRSERFNAAVRLQANLSGHSNVITLYPKNNDDLNETIEKLLNLN